MLNIAKHRMILMKLLKDFFSSSLWSLLAFKGWTAAYFFHGLERFSTDLDFDFFWDFGIDEIAETILKKYGKIKKDTKIILSYGETDTNIKIDINRNIWKNNQYEILDFYGTEVKIQNKTTLFSNKLVALSERFTNRDIYDVYFFFNHLFEPNPALIEERTGKNMNAFYTDIKLKLESLPKEYKILDGLGEVITEKQKYFVKTKLIQELINIIAMQRDFC